MKILPPTLPPSLSEPNDAIELFSTEDAVSGFRIENTWLTSAELEKTSISESILDKVSFAQVHVARFDVMDCQFLNCDFTTSKFPDASWHRVFISGTRCSGLQITKGILKNIYFKNSKLEFANFRFSRLENVVFEDCVLDDVDFYDAHLKNVEFVNCTINKITFAGAKMTNVDISKSTIEDVNGANSLRGVTMSYDQLMQIAPLLASEAGIKIK